MKKFTRFLTLALTGVVLGSTFAACGGTPVSNDDEAGDETMYQLKVSNYEGGFGRVWLDEAVKRFEEKYENLELGDGRKGVNVSIESSKNGTAGASLISNLSKSEYHVFFAEDTYYYSLTASNAVADITDIVTGSLSEITGGAETGTIADKLDPTIKSLYDLNGHYYALPHYEAPKGLIYDIDLFDKKGLWMSKDGSFGKKEDIGAENLTTGPDGKMNTYDDGLPNTFDDFFALCDYMVDEAGVTPFTWSGKHIGYTSSAIAQIWADHEGKEQFYLNYSMDGTATSLAKDVDENGIATSYLTGDEAKITADNAYKLQRQEGKYVTLAFAKRLESNSDYYTTLSYEPSEDNIAAQKTYLRSRVATSQPIAFLFEGVWWENEADESGHFDSLKVYGGETRKTRKFGLMPYPKATAAKVGEKRTIVDTTNNSASFIRKNIEDEKIMQVAKLFLQFVHTDNEMQEFTVNTSTMKPLKYSVPEAKMNRMSHFGKDIASLRSNENVDIVYAYSDHEIFVNHNDKFYLNKFAWENSAYDVNPLSVFHQEKAPTIKDYFKTMVADRENDWNNWKN
jgi:ABC-type glycerol-3-phosphate transport system substrate-binding protein